ncbi:hypothetical protein GCM10023116_15960 [Kistimonas scapharcae]|uniref:Conjugal transfer protein TraA n=1 Tax=Kistimonas scapharcae TaxID=1036133 RepID=A0ABP8V399_9GAMM
MGHSAVASYMTEERIALFKKVAIYTAFVLGVIALLAIASEVFAAGSADKTFETTLTTLTDWIEGTLGKIIALAFVIIGSVMGAARQSLMAFAVGIAAALGLYNAPGLIDNVFSATLPIIGG